MKGRERERERGREQERGRRRRRGNRERREGGREEECLLYFHYIRTSNN